MRYTARCMLQVACTIFAVSYLFIRFQYDGFGRWCKPKDFPFSTKEPIIYFISSYLFLNRSILYTSLTHMFLLPFIHWNHQIKIPPAKPRQLTYTTSFPFVQRCLPIGSVGAFLGHKYNYSASAVSVVITCRKYD